jgi:hypothetical protein
VVGPAYQFRHAELQDHLAPPQPCSGESDRPAAPSKAQRAVVTNASAGSAVASQDVREAAGAVNSDVDGPSTSARPDVEEAQEHSHVAAAPARDLSPAERRCRRGSTRR